MRRMARHKYLLVYIADTGMDILEEVSGERKGSLPCPFRLLPHWYRSHLPPTRLTLGWTRSAGLQEHLDRAVPILSKS